MNKTILDKKLSTISEVIEKNYKDEKLVGILAGASGLSLFQFYYSRYTGDDKHSELGLEILEFCIDKINSGSLYPSFCSGIAGFGWTLNHLAEEKFIENDNDHLLEILDTLMYRQMMFDMKQGHYDFLHGAIGYAFYFLSRFKNVTSEGDKKKYTKILHDFLDLLEEHSIKEEDNTVKWEFYSSTKRTKEKNTFNLGLSHGMSSIISFLAKLYQHEQFKTRTEELLLGGTQYILKSKNENENLLSVFPNSVSVNKTNLNSRLAWCYGDLGIGTAMWNVSRVLKDDDLGNFSLNVLKQTAARRTIETTRVVDPGICHGSFGNALMYSRIYKNSKDTDFKEAAEFWINDGINRATFKDGYANFKQFNPVNDEWYNTCSLLEGIAGIGLSIIDHLTDMDSSWDECLMIS